RTIDDPVRHAGPVRAHRLHVVHEAREILERAPECVELVRRPIDDDATRHAYARCPRGLAAQLARAVDVERGDAEHAGRGERDAALVRARRSAGGGERRDVDGVAGHARPDGRGRPATLSEDQEPAQQLAGAVDAYQARVLAVAADKTRNEPRREKLGETERNAEP